MQSESQIPIASQDASRRFATRVALFYGTPVRNDRHPSAVFHGLVEGGRDRCVLDRPDHGRAVGDPVYGAAAGDRRLRNGARPCAAAIIVTAFATALGFFILGTQHLPVLVFLIYAADLLPVDADGAADGCLCVARREALWPQLRTVAAVGLGRLRPRRAGLRDAVRPHRRQKPDLDHRRLRRARRAGQPRAAAAGRHQDGPPGHRRGERAAARRRLSRRHRGVGADPGQPCRLLHLCVDHLAASGVRRADDCRAVGAGRDRRDRAVRAVAALHPAAVDAGGDRGAERGRALGDHGAGSAAGRARDRPARACAELRADPGRHHGIAAASGARPCDGARAGLSDRLRRHRRRPRVDRVRHDLRELGAGHLLRDGGDGRPGRAGDLAGAGAACRISPTRRLPADRPGCRRSAARHRGRAPAAADRRDRRIGPVAPAASPAPSPARSRPCSRS